jgi:hypothetical protein
MDITYILMARGFVYLAAVIDWASPQERDRKGRANLRLKEISPGE